MRTTASQEAAIQVLREAGFVPDETSWCLRFAKPGSKREAKVGTVRTHFYDAPAPGKFRMIAMVPNSNVARIKLICKNWYSTLRTVSDHRAHTNDSSVRAFAVKPRAFGAPLCGFGA